MCVCVLQAYSCTYTHTTTAVATFRHGSFCYRTFSFTSLCHARAARLRKFHMPHWILDLKRCRQSRSWILGALSGLDLGSWASPAGWILDLGHPRQAGSWILVGGLKNRVMGIAMFWVNAGGAQQAFMCRDGSNECGPRCVCVRL